MDTKGSDRMRYHDFHGETISALGMGTMRLPMKDGQINEAEAFCHH
jgi:predicted aldo/keto reductase-like oxidoreductase